MGLMHLHWQNTGDNPLFGGRWQLDDGAFFGVTSYAPPRSLICFVLRVMTFVDKGKPCSHEYL